VVKKKKQSLAALYIILIVTAAAIFLVRHFHIKNFHIIEPDVLYASGQPRGMDYYRLLYRYHIAAIINLRSQAEHRDRNWYNEEITWVRRNGVKYFEMPLGKDINSPSHYPDANMQEQFLSIMADREDVPVLIHDSSGESRTAILVSVWLRKIHGSSVEDTVRLVEKIKDQPVTATERKFIEQLTN
jgi:protein tyrosine/serine phosphatase